ncbi:hypothetical protein EDB89DRAFT_1915198 [Lactarius sanguifluus]|nr:hypothetical protein EDB89DRAFT_1915198 [Lactarius sanguifluus]
MVFDGFLAASARAHLTHLALPHFVGVPPAAQDVPSAAVPRLALLDSSPSLAAALAPGRPLRRHAVRRPARGPALGGSLKELVFVLAPDVDVRTHGRLSGALGNTGTGLEALELSLDRSSDEYQSLQALYKQVGSLLSNIQALSNALPAGNAGDRGSQVGGRSVALALWTRPPLGSGLRCVVFLSGAHWGLERGEWRRVWVSIQTAILVCVDPARSLPDIVAL